MAVNWGAIQIRFDELAEKLLGSVEPKERPKIQKEHSQLQSLLEKYRAVEAVEKEIADTNLQVEEESDSEMKELYAGELESLEVTLDDLKSNLDDVMFPPNPFDKKDVFLEVRAGAGGKEAALFAGDLLKMYTNYALSKGWRAEIASLNQTDLGGIKEVVLNIQGRNIYGSLKFESGVHRVQRVPETESAGRIHTSTATVAVLPEVDEVDVSISPDQLRIDVYRASGAGGQHVNTTDSAVRITHLPSGLVVTCQDERSQHKNKAKAMKMLRSRLVTAHQEKKDSEMSEQRKELVGTGMRAEKVRTYNYPQNRITDHQVGLTLKKLDVIMTGQLDEIIVALRAHDKEKRRQKPFKFS